jgi:drug/metabolite transporter (DMT)-like permease
VRNRLPLLALVGVTAIWGYTFVPVQNALAEISVAGFLAWRFAVSALVLVPFAWRALARTSRAGLGAGLVAGALLALAYGLQTAGLELTTVASTGFITGLYVVFTPILALVLFRTPVPAILWTGVALSIGGLWLLSGMPGGSAVGNALVLGNALAQALQIALMERFAPRYDARVLTLVQMAVASVGFGVLAASLGQLDLPTSGTVWYGVLASGIFAGALGYLVATWVQSKVTAARAALVFTLEAPFAAVFGVALLSERLGAAGWAGCAIMLAGIVLAEPAAASTLRRLAPRRAA